MTTLIITLLSISVIQFTIYLILEYEIYRKSKKQNKHDKLNSNCSRYIHNSCDNSGQIDKATNERETA